MITAFLVLNNKGDILLSRTYREEISRGLATAFRMQVIGSKENRNPVNLITNYSFLHVRHESLYYVALCKLNADASVVFEVIHRIIEILKAYFGGKLDEDTIKAHFILGQELLDEMVDYGYPQSLSLEAIKPFIFQKGAIKPEKLKQDKLSKITIQATGASPWRGGDIRYKKNEIYIDAVESVNLLVSVDGKRLRADVSGSVLMKVHLSGMPECKFGLNDKLLMDKEARSGTKTKGQGIAIDDCTFHQCVRLGKFDSDRTISFIPPDGEFELMKYRTTQNIEIPFSITPIVYYCLFKWISEGWNI